MKIIITPYLIMEISILKLGDLDTLAQMRVTTMAMVVVKIYHL